MNYLHLSISRLFRNGCLFILAMVFSTGSFALSSSFSSNPTFWTFVNDDDDIAGTFSNISGDPPGNMDIDYTIQGSGGSYTNLHMCTSSGGGSPQSCTLDIGSESALSSVNATIVLRWRLWDVQHNISNTYWWRYNLDNINPALSINFNGSAADPENTLYTTGSTVSISGTWSDNSTSTTDYPAAYVNSADRGVQSITVNGTQVSSLNSNGTWSHTHSLSAGSNNITIIAYDKAGNSVSGSYTVVRDNTNPTATLSSLNTYVNNTTLTVSGSATDNSGVASATITISGGVASNDSVTLDGSGNFSKNYTLNNGDGSYTVTLNIADNAGNTGSAQGSTTLDTAQPTLTGVSLGHDYGSGLNGGYSNSPSTVTITGTTYDSGSGLATINSGNVSISITNTATQATDEVTLVTDGNNYFQTYLPISTMGEGHFQFIVSSTDNAGNTKTVTRTVTIDTIDPVINVSNLATGDLVYTGGTIDGSVTDDTNPDLTINGDHVTLQGSNDTFSHNVNQLSLPEGRSDLSFQATDQAGNTATVEYAVYKTDGALICTSP